MLMVGRCQSEVPALGHTENCCRYGIRMPYGVRGKRGGAHSTRFSSVSHATSNLDIKTGLALSRTLPGIGETLECLEFPAPRLYNAATLYGPSS